MEKQYWSTVKRESRKTKKFAAFAPIETNEYINFHMHIILETFGNGKEIGREVALEG